MISFYRTFQMTSRVEFQNNIGFNTVSDWQTISCGVPQGSILGPLLFFIYINDLSANAKSVRSVLYADDTSLVVRGTDHNQIIITEWLEAKQA